MCLSIVSTKVHHDKESVPNRCQKDCPSKSLIFRVSPCHVACQPRPPRTLIAIKAPITASHLEPSTHFLQENWWTFLEITIRVKADRSRPFRGKACLNPRYKLNPGSATSQGILNPLDLIAYHLDLIVCPPIPKCCSYAFHTPRKIPTLSEHQPTVMEKEICWNSREVHLSGIRIWRQR